MNISVEELLLSISFKLSRSGGKGGQHVNKVSSKAELNFDLEGTGAFSPEEKIRIREKLHNKLTAGGKIQVICDEDRSQYKNKQLAIARLMRLLKDALYVAPKRKPTKIPKKMHEARLDEKRKVALKKIDRNTRFF